MSDVDVDVVDLLVLCVTALDEEDEIVERVFADANCWDWLGIHMLLPYGTTSFDTSSES